MKSGMRSLRSACGPILFSLATLIVNVGVEPLRSQAAMATSGDLAEQRICARCHSDEVKNLTDNPHAHSVNMRAGKNDTCAACHGPGTAHVVSEGDPGKILNFSQMDAMQVDRICLQCHGGSEEAFTHSEHGKGHLSCTSCHSIHAAGDSKSLLKSPTTTLCFGCHAEVKTQFSAPFHHKVQEGLIECTDCHNPHNSSGNRFQARSVRQTAACTDCHTQMAGSFTYKHAPMQTEGCMACHVSHGGSNSHMLIRASIDAICRQCHLPAPNLGSGAHLNAGAEHPAESKTCTDCHADIHGSNTSEVFIPKQ